MSANAADLFAKQYSTAVELLLQQKGTRLRQAVMSGSHQGSQASPVDQVGAVNMQQVTTRFGAIGRVDALLSRRWVNPSDFDLNQLFDTFDDLKLISDPKSVYVQNAMNAADRTLDDLVIAAFFGLSSTGTDGTSTVAFGADGGIVVPVNEGAGSNTNLTVAKLRAANKNFRAAEVDMERDELFLAMSASQHDSLLQEAQVISTDFNEKPVLVDGRIQRFMGFTFIDSERLDVDVSSFRRCPAWAKSGMHLGIWEDKTVSVDKRIDLTGHPWQAYLKMSMGSTRKEGKKVQEILCNEA